MRIITIIFTSIFLLSGTAVYADSTRSGVVVPSPSIYCSRIFYLKHYFYLFLLLVTILDILYLSHVIVTHVTHVALVAHTLIGFFYLLLFWGYKWVIDIFQGAWMQTVSSMLSVPPKELCKMELYNKAAYIEKVSVVMIDIE